jgi:hypothetical protein
VAAPASRESQRRAGSRATGHGNEAGQQDSADAACGTVQELPGPSRSVRLSSVGRHVASPRGAWNAAGAVVPTALQPSWGAAIIVGWSPVGERVARASAVHRDDITEFHYITAIENVPSIVERGILSHNLAKRVPHRDVSMEEVQDIRQGKRVPNGRLLHDYANVYFQARNPMLYKRLDLRNELAVIRVSPLALDIPEAVVADGNAAVGFTAYQPAPHGVAIVDKETTFAARWTHSDPWEYRRRKAASCAELLVPDRIPADYVIGAWVASMQALRALRALGCPIESGRARRLFFLA